MVTESKPEKHLQKTPKLARQWGASYVRPPEEVHYIIMLSYPLTVRFSGTRSSRINLDEKVYGWDGSRSPQ